MYLQDNKESMHENAFDGFISIFAIIVVSLVDLISKYAPVVSAGIQVIIGLLTAMYFIIKIIYQLKKFKRK